jgi:hypothetical protein
MKTAGLQSPVVAEGFLWRRHHSRVTIAGTCLVHVLGGPSGRGLFVFHNSHYKKRIAVRPNLWTTWTQICPEFHVHSRETNSGSWGDAVESALAFVEDTYGFSRDTTLQRLAQKPGPLKAYKPLPDAKLGVPDGLHVPVNSTAYSLSQGRIDSLHLSCRLDPTVVIN